ncbi:MAG: T9SS type A sorting domain-containing protein, partial [Bacteroidetes bacterium]|nr:T9SS type A sorting domain-containing protein [Bacteroidota bacterium]
TGHFWVFGDGSTSTAENPSHTYANNGIYLVWQIVYAPQCGFDIKLRFIFVFSRGVRTDGTDQAISGADVSLKDLVIYPNPSSGIVQLDLDVKGSVRGDVEMTISDVAGNTTVSRKIKPVDQQLDLSGLQPGYYILSVTDGESVLQQKILIMR